MRITWPSTEAWRTAQAELAAKLIVSPLGELPRFVAGADAAFSRDGLQVLAAAVVYDRVEQRIVEIAHAKKLVLACCGKYRVPEPTRQADLEVARLKASG